MSSQVLSKCLTLETSYRIVHLSVRFLSFIIYNEEIATKLCSHECKCLLSFHKVYFCWHELKQTLPLPSDPCPFLKIFQYVTSRPDKSASEDMWNRFELEVIYLAVFCFEMYYVKMALKYLVPVNRSSGY